MKRLNDFHAEVRRKYSYPHIPGMSASLINDLFFDNEEYEIVAECGMIIMYEVKDLANET